MTVQVLKLYQLLKPGLADPGIAIAATAEELQEALASDRSTVPRAVLAPVARPGGKGVSFLAYTALGKDEQPKLQRVRGYLYQLGSAAAPPVRQKLQEPAVGDAAPATFSDPARR